MDTAPYEYDICVSVAHADRLRVGAGQPVVAAVLRRLDQFLSDALGRNCRILGFEEESRELGERELQELGKAAVLVVLKSPEWARSPGRIGELLGFQASRERAPVQFIELAPLYPGQSLPDAGGALPEIQLWHDDGGEPAAVPPNSRRFIAAMVQAVRQIAEILGVPFERLPSNSLDSMNEAPAEENRPDSSPATHDRYRTLTDDPARIDALERGPFAAVIAARIAEVRQGYSVREEGRQRAFMVHLHGPWGSGKSSMLGLIQAELEKRREGTEPSLVVWFNAWKHQRMRPPWWALLNAIYQAAVSKRYATGEEPARTAQRWKLRLLWWRWRLRAEWVPLLLIAALLGGLMFALLTGISLGTLETPLKIIGALITAGAGVYTYARLMLFGSGKAAQTYAELTTDPYQPVVRLFNRLVETIGPPLVVFIDDLDRCDSAFVVELLEGIQTLFRDAQVTYVVAAERKWICSSFEKKYGDFAGAIGDPGRPLGHLFLEKMFQISVGMPRLTPEIQARYLAGLLDGTPADGEPDDATARTARERVSGIVDEAGIQRVIAESRNASVAEQRAVRAAAALQITSAEASAATEHRLQKFAHLLEPNPRSMKRLVNAVGMAQARGILEGRTALPETRARWVMLTLRWPVLAEFLADNPEAVRHWTPGATPADAKELEWPAPIKDLLGNRAVMAVVGDPGGDGALTPENLAPLLG